MKKDRFTENVRRPKFLSGIHIYENFYASHSLLIFKYSGYS
jgi:hypothetical protein